MPGLTGMVDQWPWYCRQNVRVSPSQALSQCVLHFRYTVTHNDTELFVRQTLCWIVHHKTLASDRSYHKSDHGFLNSGRYSMGVEASRIDKCIGDSTSLLGPPLEHQSCCSVNTAAFASCTILCTTIIKPALNVHVGSPRA